MGLLYEARSITEIKIRLIDVVANLYAVKKNGWFEFPENNEWVAMLFLHCGLWPFNKVAVSLLPLRRSGHLMYYANVIQTSNWQSTSSYCNKTKSYCDLAWVKTVANGSQTQTSCAVTMDEKLHKLSPKSGVRRKWRLMCTRTRVNTRIRPV